MVDIVTNVSRSGLREWLLQRITAVIIGTYTVFLLIFFLINPDLQYNQWVELFMHPFMRIFSFLALLSVVYHAWIGIWIVLTDYLKCVWGRILLQVVVVIALLGYLAWGIDLIW